MSGVLSSYVFSPSLSDIEALGEGKGIILRKGRVLERPRLGCRQLLLSLSVSFQGRPLPFRPGGFLTLRHIREKFPRAFFFSPG